MSVTVHRSVVALATLLTASTFGLGAVTPASAATVCGPAGYSAPIATTTSLSLTRSAGQYGSVNVATVRVSSGAGTPAGTVRISVSNGASYTASLNNNGFAQRQLPRNLAPSRTHTVTASYDGQGSCRASGPVSKYYTVVRAGTAVRGLDASDIRRGSRPHVTGRVTSYTGVTPHGKVRISLVKGGQTRQERTVPLRGGRFGATFGRSWTRGPWTVRTAFVSTRYYRAATDSTTFRVGRK
jgi:hypothetical protein